MKINQGNIQNGLMGVAVVYSALFAALPILPSAIGLALWPLHSVGALFGAAFPHHLRADTLPIDLLNSYRALMAVIFLAITASTLVTMPDWMDSYYKTRRRVLLGRPRLNYRIIDVGALVACLFFTSTGLFLADDVFGTFFIIDFQNYPVDRDSASSSAYAFLSLISMGTAVFITVTICRIRLLFGPDIRSSKV